MRPRLHFTAEHGWINDPHGITVRAGRYHQFHQAVPGSTTWEPGCHWGHAVGDDLFSLEHRVPAIAPGDGDVGIWTGCLVEDADGRTRIFYTTVAGEDLALGRIRVATPRDDDWTVWDKGAVVIEPPDVPGLNAFRDPFVLRDGDVWRMYIGGGRSDGSPVVLHYASDDLDHWEFRGIALERSPELREPVWMGELWECPQLLEVDGGYAMLLSVVGDGGIQHSAYALGTLDDGRFVASSWDRLSYGPSYYAPSLFRDTSGRPCAVFWLREVADVAGGWAGAHSIPYLFRFDGARLVLEPHPDLERHLAAAGPAVAAVTWTPGTEALEIGAAATLRVNDGELALQTPEYTATCPVGAGSIRVLVDGPVLEVVADGRLVGGAIAAVDAPVVVGEGVAVGFGRLA
jgi:beta-fructofuranosidase